MLTRRELLHRFAGAIIGVSVGPALIEASAPIGYIGGALVGHLRAKASPYTCDPVTGSITLRYQRPNMPPLKIDPKYGTGTLVCRATIPERYLYTARDKDSA